MGHLFVVSAVRSRSVGNGRKFQAGHLLNHAHHLAAVAELVVVPDIENATVPLHDGCQGVDHAGMA
jgi:hypothetical protein